MLPFLILLLAPLALVIATLTLRRRWLALRGTRGRHACIYWGCSLGGHLLFGYAMLLLALSALDRLPGSGSRFAAFWPSLARCCGMVGESHFLLLLDAAAVLVLALGFLALARGFGHVDEFGSWQPAVRVAGTDAAVSGDTLPPDGSG